MNMYMYVKLRVCEIVRCRRKGNA